MRLSPVCILCTPELYIKRTFCLIRHVHDMYNSRMTDPPVRTLGNSRYTDLQQRWRELSACAAGITPSRIPLEPAPAEIAIVADDLRVLARKVDALVEAYGIYVDANSCGIDRSVFENVLLNALDGNALYEIEQASQELADDNAEHAYYTRHNAGVTE